MGRSDTLGLTLPDVLALNVRHIRKKLEHDIGDERTGYARVSCRVSSSGISSTTAATRRSLVMVRHTSMTSS